MFTDKVVVITGGAHGIGKTTGDEFRKNGAHVCVIDKSENDYFTGDIAEEQTLCTFSKKVITEFGRIDYLINNALPIMKGIDSCSYDEFNYALRVGVTAPFYLSKLFLPYFSKDGAIVNISSSRDRMSQRRDLRPDSRAGSQPGRQGAGQFDFPGLDRYEFYGICRSRCCTAAGSPCWHPY